MVGEALKLLHSSLALFASVSPPNERQCAVLLVQLLSVAAVPDAPGEGAAALREAVARLVAHAAGGASGAAVRAALAGLPHTAKSRLQVPI